ncbi:MAG: hypothetical protein KatS3mg115_1945 [Candidatus Poribacteria bacterium]|nr:MAG: hypothetical protein KatS3mg115_1945 [Candidatus Poribacteria bacterium]
MALRRAVGVLWVLGYAAFWFGCRGGGPTPAPSAPAPIPEEIVSFHADYETCGTCHRTIYLQWEQSRHAQAWRSETFRVASANYTRTECLSCHAPDLILRTGLGNEPALRDEVREAGVTCITCHQDPHADDWAMHGPYEVDSPGHDSIANPAYQTAEVCASCHGGLAEFDQYNSWKEGPYGQSEFPCQACHMEPRKGWLADEYQEKPQRWYGDHSFPGAHVPEFVQMAAVLQARIEGNVLIAQVENQAGHLFPGGAHRTAVLRVFAREQLLGEERFSYERNNRIPSGQTVERRFPLEGITGTIRVELRYHRVIVNASGDGLVEEPEGILIAELTLERES